MLPRHREYTGKRLRSFSHKVEVRPYSIFAYLHWEAEIEPGPAACADVALCSCDAEFLNKIIGPKGRPGSVSWST